MVPPSIPCNIIGNGPSKRFWRLSDHVSEHSIGCNLEEACRWTSIYDRKILSEVTGKKRRVVRPAILVGNAAEEYRNDHSAGHRMVVIGTVEKKPLRIFNAGHGAIVWALRAQLEPIHLWGFDSIWTGLRETDSDQYWPRGDDLTKAPVGWAKSWSLIFEVYTNLTLLVHCPEGSALPKRSPLMEFRQHFQLIYEKELVAP